MRIHLRRLAPALLTVALSVAAVSPAHAQSSIDYLGRPAPHILQQMEDFAAKPFVPEDLRNVVLAAVAFYRGEGEGGVPLPENAPIINQFIWPTVSASCINGNLSATGTAIAIPGPASLPLPGTPAGQTSFVFTALGTSTAADQQRGMFVHWLNISNGRVGVTQLTKGSINPQGPATLSGTADTGHGQVLAWLDGGVTLADATGAPTNTCNFAPTATSFFVN
ncbi:Rv1157c family protein [Corynebacterium kalinowskii]|uniref:Rv1157c family protein n=1 Tax=Corynebacterium kalinowskii TaxID=2675216 RepID=UPI001E5A2F7B|nr:hypothetical protein [Corynebacterium kalinowskii]